MSKIFHSAKLFLSLVIVLLASTALMLGKIDGTSYSVVITAVTAIFSYTRMKTDTAVINKGP